MQYLWSIKHNYLQHRRDGANTMQVTQQWKTLQRKNIAKLLKNAKMLNLLLSHPPDTQESEHKTSSYQADEKQPQSHDEPYQAQLRALNSLSRPWTWEQRSFGVCS